MLVTIHFYHIWKPKYIDLARARGEAFDKIYSLLKQNVKSRNAKRRRQRER